MIKLTTNWKAGCMSMPVRFPMSKRHFKQRLSEENMPFDICQIRRPIERRAITGIRVLNHIFCQLKSASHKEYGSRQYQAEL